MCDSAQLRCSELAVYAMRRVRGDALVPLEMRYSKIGVFWYLKMMLKINASLFV